MPLVRLVCPECGNGVGVPEGSTGRCDGKLDRRTGKFIEHKPTTLKRESAGQTA